MSAKTLSWVLAAAVAVYIGFAGMRAWALIVTGEPALIVFGLSVVVIPAIGVWVLWRELRFGMATARMGKELGAEGGLPVDDLPKTPSGRVSKDAADVRFAEYSRDVQASPEDWRCWYRLAIGYDDCRDRKRARAAMRRAIVLFEPSPPD